MRLRKRRKRRKRKIRSVWPAEELAQPEVGSGEPGPDRENKADINTTRFNTNDA
jgi:hypothetical protein